MFFIVWINKDIIKKRKKRDRTGIEDSYGTITKVILWTITPVLLSTTIYNIGNLLDNPIYQNIMVGIFHVSEKTNSASWGIYSGYYRLLTTMPIAIASSLSTAIVPSLVRSYTAKDQLAVKSKVTLAQKFSMLIAFPCGMGLSVLGGPINAMLFGSMIEDTVIIMIFSVFTVVAFSLSTISNAILQGIDKLNVPIKNSAISLGIHLIILPVLLIVFRLGIYAVVIGDFTFAMTVAVLNSFSIKRYLGYRQEIQFTLIKPFVCAVVMGIGCLLVYKLGMLLLPINAIWTILAILIGVCIYGVVLIFTKTITEDELYAMPKGTALIGFLKKVHLL
jgi:stage V sporulation protein B